MKKLKIIVFVLGFFVWPLGLSAQSASGNDSDGFLGTVANGVYRNNFFGFKLPIPTELYVLSVDEKDKYKDIGAKAIVSGIDGNKAALEKAVTDEVVIFALADQKPGSQASTSINFGALKQGSGVSSHEVANKSRAFLLQNPSFNLTRDTTATKLGGVNFSLVELEGNFNGQILRFKYYVTIRKGYSLTAVITYLDQKSLDKFEKILNTITFDSK